MALRSTCLCDGKYIGIETIFTVVDGMQINIPEKVEALRKKSRNNELFCPCGCGANLILVAGDRNLREQHFRLKDAQADKTCRFVAEGPVSIYSKIVLKCWLDDNYPSTDIETRVPICAVDDSRRRYEMTLLARDKRVAISYCYDRSNLSDDKLDILDGNSADIHIHYISDIDNMGIFLQYPEMMMKVQKRQDYCLFLELVYDDFQMVSYQESKLKVIFYFRHNNGSWEEMEIATAPISSFSFDSKGNLLCFGKSVRILKDHLEQQYIRELEKQRMEQEQREKEAEQLRQEHLALLKQKRAFAAEAERKRKEQRECELKAKKEQEKITHECYREKVDAIIDNDQEHPFRDADGNRWVRCEYCGQISMEDNFVSYGGIHHANLGTCKECNRKSGISVLPQYATKVETEMLHKRPKYNPAICPECGGKLMERRGRYGAFWGCYNYPRCRYTRKA